MVLWSIPVVAKHEVALSKAVGGLSLTATGKAAPGLAPAVARFPAAISIAATSGSQILEYVSGVRFRKRPDPLFLGSVGEQRRPVERDLSLVNCHLSLMNRKTARRRPGHWGESPIATWVSR